MIDLAPSEGRQGLLSRARKLEFDTTLHFLDKHLSPQATLLELGAGKGEYSLHFARRGHRVLATDATESQVQSIAQQVAAEGLAVQVRQADATRLEALSDWDFQGVLCLGPYHHFRTRELRRRCLLECRRVVHDRGVVAVSYLNRAFAVGTLLRKGIYLSAQQYASLQSNDDKRTDYPDELLNRWHFTTPEGVEAEMRSCGFEIVDHVTTDGIYEHFADAFEELDDASYLDFFSYHLRTCGQPSQRGAGHHGLVILRKC